MYNQIYNIDCLEGMRSIPDGAIDFVLCDLPYGITDAPFDIKIDLKKFWEEINRITKYNAACAMFAKSKFLIELVNANFKYYRYKWVWQKRAKSGFLNAKKIPMQMHEDILIFYRKLPTYNPQFTQGKPYKKKCDGYSLNYRALQSPNWKRNYIENNGTRYPVDVLKFNDVYSQGRGTVHPTQKPVELLEYLIKTYTNEGEVVLDATIGSGSTAVACVNTGRQFIGYETDAHYFEVAQRRIREAQAKKAQELFDSTAVE